MNDQVSPRSGSRPSPGHLLNCRGGRQAGPILCSACLLGVRCRYDGENKAGPSYTPLLERLLQSGRLVLVCPEQLGGLPTPRPPAAIEGGDGGDVLDGRARVLTSDGQDVTPQFVRGAEEALRVARLAGCRSAVLKCGSPSCGVARDLLEGEERAPLLDGVTAALLKRNGIEVVDEQVLSCNRKVASLMATREEPGTYSTPG